MGSTALRKLEDNTLTVSELLKEKARALIFDPGNCQLTIQLTRENLDGVGGRLPCTESTMMTGEDLSHQTADLSIGSSKTKQALNDVESIQRQTLALIPTGMELSVVAFGPLRNKLTITDMSTKDLSVLGTLLQTNQRICTLLEQQNTQIQNPLAKSMEDSFVFQDVLGREHRLEYHWFQHWEIFVAMLKCVFKDMPGEDYIALNRYLIYDARAGDRRLDENVSGEAVVPGSRIKMSVTMSKRRFADAQCPRCSRLGSAKCCNTSNFFHW